MTGSAKTSKEKTSDEFERQQETSQATRQRITDTLDPTAKAGLDFVINTATGLADAPLSAGINPDRLEALQGIGVGVGGGGPLDFTEDFIGGDFVAGEFQEGGREALERAGDFAGERAAREVGDVFTQGGRTGSRANAAAVAEGVARATSPFAFGFEQSELARKDAFQARELQRQDADTARKIAAEFGLQDVQSKDDILKLQASIARAEALGEIDAARREELEAPFRRLGLISDVVTGAASLLPKTRDVTGISVGTGESSGTSAGTRKSTEFGLSIPFI